MIAADKAAWLDAAWLRRPLRFLIDAVERMQRELQERRELDLLDGHALCDRDRLQRSLSSRAVAHWRSA